ncbi:uncharacterized protein LOC124358307 [Homalodisca vitripennis]|uniref:uncharacterized protein LOC124358307 n=1 Tax=Homalodisca vitripennis TaxID=197043 RepID=UPI001EEB1B3B|nr:uncharacterized protein LOC124358307 [Homalodisca vitripennis]
MQTRYDQYRESKDDDDQITNSVAAMDEDPQIIEGDIDVMVNLTVEHQGVNAEVVANLLPGFQDAVAVDANVIPIHNGIPHITATFPLEHQGQEYAPHIDMTIGLHLNGNADNHGQVHNLMVQDIYINGIPYTSGQENNPAMPGIYINGIPYTGGSALNDQAMDNEEEIEGSDLNDQEMDNEEEPEGSDLNDQAMNNVPEIEGK